MDNLLIITVGLPRSGKSTWAKSQNHPIVNLDSIRLGLHGEAYIESVEPFIIAIAQVMVKALFFAGHKTVIVDATNTTKQRRKIWISDKWKTKYKLFSTPLDECIKRAKNTNQEYLIPVIENMYKNWEDVDTIEENLVPYS